MIKNVVFDYAGVLADFNEQTFFKILGKSLGFDEKTCRELKRLCFDSALYRDYQTGLISRENFLTYLTFKHHNLREEILKVANTDFSELLKPKPEMVSLLKRLHKEGYRTFILSNTIPETEQVIISSNFAKDVDVFELSNRTHYAKPAPESFAHLIYMNGVNPEETLFIDDNEQNIDMARLFDINAIHFTSEAEAISQIEEALYGSAPQKNWH